MREPDHRLMKFSGLVVGLLTLSGCAAMDRQQALDTEKLLAAAGFNRLAADSAERQQELAKLPSLEMVISRQGGKTVYTYADPQTCRCFYVGGPKAYAQYRGLEVSEEMADRNGPSMNAASTNWDVWGSWDAGWAPDAFAPEPFAPADL